MTCDVKGCKKESEHEVKLSVGNESPMRWTLAKLCPKHWADLKGRNKYSMGSKPKQIRIVEGTSGVWHYHLSETGLNGKPALCGETGVMQTNCRINSWGVRTHLNETYCEECNNIREKLI